MVDTAQAYELGLRALQANELGVARRYLSSAIAENPGDARPQHLLGVIALSEGRLDEAREAFRQSLELAPEGGEAAASWVGLGRAQLPAGRLEAALSCFQQAARLDPRFAPALSGQAAVWCDLGDYRSAEQAARRALALGDDVRTQLVLARVLLFQSRIEEAEELLRPLSAAPEVGFVALFHLAGCAVARGDTRQAESMFRDLLRKNPTYPGHLELARLKRFRDPSDPDLLRMEDLMKQLPDTSGRMTDLLRADLSFGLAKAYDDLGDGDRAFPRLKMGNTLRAAQEPFDEVALKKEAEGVIATATNLSTQNLPGRPDAATDASPLLIAALPRSGSTLLEQMLCGHPAIEAGGEYSAFVPVLESLVNACERQGRDTGAVSEAEVASRMIAAELEGVGSEVKFLTDKSPVMFMYAGLMGVLRADARVVHLRRHPLDTSLSQYMQSFARGLGWTYDLDRIARYRAVYEDVMEAWRKLLGPRLLELTYESLVHEPRKQLERILGFCGLDYHPACEQFVQRQRAVWTASGVQVREPLTNRGVGRWRRYRHHLADLEKQLQPGVTQYEELLRREGTPY